MSSPDEVGRLSPMAAQQEQPDVIEVEVERLPAEGAGADPEPQPAGGARRMGRVLSPVLAGFLIDGLDAITRGPLASLGLLGGLVLGYFLGRSSGLSMKQSRILGLAVGIYCLLPMTGFLPIGILTGIFIQYFRTDPKTQR